jgi:hypothetical protein
LCYNFTYHHKSNAHVEKNQLNIKNYVENVYGSQTKLLGGIPSLDGICIQQDLKIFKRDEFI